jgi:altronate dehydratase small subunit
VGKQEGGIIAMKIDAIMISEKDNVATALRDIRTGETISLGLGDQTTKILIINPIPYGHKFAIKDISKGENIFKYGEVMGRATQDIALGAHAHIQNIESLRGRGDFESQEV